MVVLPPGTLLQLMYLEERLKSLTPGRFIEIGPGSGEITALLLAHGWKGSTYDLEETTIKKLLNRFAVEIHSEQLEVIYDDFIHTDHQKTADLVISCMVMEHLTESQLANFMTSAASALLPSGIMIGLVPGSPDHWGIEDDIAGHLRRYTRASLANFINNSNWKLLHLSGLTYPVSNFLLPLSNFIVQRNESYKLSYDNIKKTKLSGNRDVRFKTSFPDLLKIILNRFTMMPFHYLQKACRNIDRALVVYFEAKPVVRISANEK